MLRDACGSTREKCHAEDIQPLEPGYQYCSHCGEIVHCEKVLVCQNCNRKGCAKCMQVANDGLRGEGQTAVCSDECELAWLEYLAKNEERGHLDYQDWIGGKIAEVRARMKRPAEELQKG